MKKEKQHLVFFLDDQRFALHLSTVQRVVRAVEITPLPGAPGIVLGAINERGRVIPVIDLRTRFSMPKREIRINDQLIIARISQRDIAFPVTGAAGVMEPAGQNFVDSEKIAGGLRYVEGVAKHKDGMVLIQSLDNFLTFEEDRGLEKAIKKIILKSGVSRSGEFPGWTEYQKATCSKLLGGRSDALARNPKKQVTEDVFIRVVSFSLAHESYAFELGFVRKVLPFTGITPLPCTPGFVLGIINDRGRILSVIDIKEFLGHHDRVIRKAGGIVVVQMGEMEFGILVDAIIGEQKVSLKAVRPYLPTLQGMREEYLMGITKQHLIILDAARILSDDRIIVDEEVES